MSSTASSSPRPCSRVSERHVGNESAWPIAARTYCARRPRSAAAGGEVVLDRAEVAVEVAESALDGRHERLVAQQADVHRLGAAVERVQLAQGRSRPFGRILDRRPRPRVRRWVRRTPVRRAGGEQRVLVREVPVDGRAADAGALGDRADRGLRRAELLVQRDGALGDPPPRLLLELGAALHPVGTLLIGHICPIILTDAARCRIFRATPLSNERRRRWKLQSQA